MCKLIVAVLISFMVCGSALAAVTTADVGFLGRSGVEVNLPLVVVNNVVEVNYANLESAINAYILSLVATGLDLSNLIDQNTVYYDAALNRLVPGAEEANTVTTSGSRNTTKLYTDPNWLNYALMHNWTIVATGDGNMSPGSCLAYVSTDNNSTGTTLQDINGLSITAATGRYAIVSELFVIDDVVGGSQYSIGGTEINDVNIVDIIKTPVGTTVHTSIRGYLSVTTAGTVTVKFAESSVSGVSTVKKGSWLKVERIN